MTDPLPQPAQTLTRRQRWTDLAGGAVFALLMGLIASNMGPWMVAVSVLLGLAVALRRISLVAMSALAVAAALIQVVSGEIHWGADLGYGLLFFTLGRSESRSWRRFGLGCAVLASVVAGVHMALVEAQLTGPSFRQVAAGITFAVLTAFVVVGGWSLGYLRLQRELAQRAHVETLVGEAERLRLQEAYQHEQERSQIATEMHDIVAHSWAVVAAQADGARYAVRTDPAAAEGALEVIGETARSAMNDLRDILHRLRYQESAGSTPGWAAADQIVARMRASGMEVRLQESGERPTSQLLALNATRFMGEALTNALKHGDLAHPVTVDWDFTDGLHLRVVNTIAGDRGDDRLNTGHGLIGMSERADALGGTLTAAPHGSEWRVHLVVPPAQEQP